MILPRFLLRCSLVVLAPIAADAAGTYYNGQVYQSPQQHTQKTYTTTTGSKYTTGTIYRGGYTGTNGQNAASVRYNPAQNVPVTQPRQQKQNTTTRHGLSLDAGLSHQFADWKLEMKESGSILHYNDVRWNVFDANLKYVFDAGNTPMQINVGGQYGMQWGESSMTDDDMTNGGYLVTQWVENGDFLFAQQGHALSIGTSDGGNLMGFNVGFGLTDFFKVGSVRITPSLGYRYFKYKLETTKNFGLTVDSAACYNVQGTNEIQCDPIVIGFDGPHQAVVWERNDDGYLKNTPYPYLDTAGTYYYEQPGTSHSYETVWSGPYLALDMIYDINANNAVDAHVELGLPGYKSTGDQPYRFDWNHPDSVEDSAGMFSGFHFGAGANWMTALTNSVSMTFGFTFDYYSISGADAKTHLSGAYYEGIKNERRKLWEEAGRTEAEMLDTTTDSNGVVNGDIIAINIVNLSAECPGWVCSAKNEIKSFYKSMGIRVGVNAKF